MCLTDTLGSIGAIGGASKMPWDCKGIGRCWKAQFNRTTPGSGTARRVAGSVAFKTQPLREGWGGSVSGCFWGATASRPNPVER